MAEFLSGWNGFWAMVRAGFMGYGWWLAGFGLFFLLQFVDLSGQCSVGVMVSGFVQIWWWFGGLVEWWWVGGELVFLGSGVGCEIVKKFSFCGNIHFLHF